MEKEKTMELIKDTGLSQEEVEYVLTQDEKLLKLLRKLDGSLFSYGLKILSLDVSSAYKFEALKYMLKKNDNALYIARVLANHYLVERGLAFSTAKLLSLSKEYFNAEYAYQVGIDKNLIDKGESIKAMKLINRSKKDFNAAFAYEALTNEDLIELGKNFEVALLLQKIDKIETAKTVYEEKCLKFFASSNHDNSDIKKAHK